jgi:hypothetical protein
VLYRTEQLAFVQFRTVDWPGYKDFGNYAQLALFPEHLRPADPQSPGVVGFVQALVREATAQQQHLANRGHQANGQTSAPIGAQVSHRAVDDAAKAPKATQGNGVKPPPKSAPARQRRARANAEDGHSLEPVRSISGLTLVDFLYDR